NQREVAFQPVHATLPLSGLKVAGPALPLPVQVRFRHVGVRYMLAVRKKQGRCEPPHIWGQVRIAWLQTNEQVRSGLTEALRERPPRKYHARHIPLNRD